MENLKRLIYDTRKHNKDVVTHIVEDYCKKAFEVLKNFLEKEPFFAEYSHISVGIISFDLINGTVEVENTPTSFSTQCIEEEMEDCCSGYADSFSNLSVREVNEFADLINLAFAEKSFSCYVSLLKKDGQICYPIITAT